MASVAVQQHPADKPKGRKGPRPNYNQIHRNLLPVEVHPLPVLIPHNPLSLVAIALSYLTQYLAPPQRKLYKGYFSSATSSIHVTDPAAIRALWEDGFFGRGSLSRSEPTWLETQKKVGGTAEENTGQRRNERRQQKLERAKKEQEEIAKKLLEEKRDDPLKTNNGDLNGIDSVLESSTATPIEDQSGIEGFDQWKQAVELNGLPTPPPTSSSEADLTERPMKRLQRTKTVRFSPTIEAREFDLTSPVISPIKSPGTSTPEELEPPVPVPVENKEHLNLSLEEAFFLSYGLGVLEVSCEDADTILPATSMFSLFKRHSYHPSRSLSVKAEPDDPFMLSYSVYHHYRSLGWVVRSGVKFSVDFLLYNRGPAFSHAEFAVVILPSYSHKYWHETPEKKDYVASKTKKTWWWLHGVNRVQAQVHKQLILCYVDIPPPLSKEERGANIDIGRELTRYKVRDVGVRRWTPNRTRD